MTTDMSDLQGTPPGCCPHGVPTQLTNSACKDCEIERLRGLLAGVVDLAEWWINRTAIRGMSEQEYKTWYALGHGSDTLRNAKMVLRITADQPDAAPSRSVQRRVALQRGEAMPDFSVERLRNFETSDALGNGDFSVCGLAADEIERLTARLAEAGRLLGAWFYWFDNANCTGIGQDTYRATDAFLAAELSPQRGHLSMKTNPESVPDDPEATIHKEIGISRAGRSQRRRVDDAPQD